MENETWKQIPSIPGAKASSLGRVWMPSIFGVPVGRSANAKRDYITKPIWGYPQKDSTGRDGAPKRLITVWRGRNYKIHRLVCEAFHGPAPSHKHIVLHLNEDASDNRPENLKWGTRKENQNFPKVKQAFQARVGVKSPTYIYAERKVKDPSYMSRAKKHKE